MKTVIISVMSSSWCRLGAVVLLLSAPFILAGCAQDDAGTPAASGDCPAAPVNVVVSVDQWGEIVSALGGSCARVTTVLAGSSVDPHDYEPSPADAAKFEGAQLVVINGGHYDEWAAKLAATSAPDAPTVDAVESATGEAEHEDGEGHGHESGEEHHHDTAEGNPHVWYEPAAVNRVIDAVSAELSTLAPDARDYFADRRTEVTESFSRYNELIADIKAHATGKRYAATESVFDPMAAALDLHNATPAGYQAASSNETDPSPADLDAFLKLLDGGGVDVLIFNTQTEGSVPDRLRSVAEKSGVPVVEVTETVAPGAGSFEAWQVDQLTALAEALGVTV
jgi:zinc/manganese transport system substrate-binding protein